MSAEETTPEQIEKVAGTEDENGVIQPSVEEILDPDPEDATAARPNRDADPDLACPAADRVRHQSVQPHHRQRHAHQPDGADQSKDDFADRIEAVPVERLDRLDVIGGHVRIQTAQHLAQRRQHGRGITNCFGHERHIAARLLAEREIDHFLRRFTRIEELRGFHDADDFDPSRPRVVHPDAPAHRVPFRPVVAREGLVHDRDSRHVRGIRRAEATSRQHRNPHGPEVPLVDDAHPRVHARLTTGQRVAFRDHRRILEIPEEWHRRRCTRRPHTR